jgi:cytochrome c-type biogenesis protein CcmE
MIEDGLEAAFAVVRAQVPIGVVALSALAGAIVGIALLLERERRPFDFKVASSLLVLGGVAGWLLWSSDGCRTSYYKFVDEVVANPQMFRARHLKVHGCVVPGSIERRLGTGEYRFRLKSRPDRPPAVIEVRYAGLVPDTFRSGAEIVADGTLVGDGELDVIPYGITAKCPSEYAPSLEPGWARAEPRP